MELPSGPMRGRPGTQSGEMWFQRFSRPTIFLIVAIALVGAYTAFTIPVSVFPNTDFPRIVIGVDNGVAPIDQMLGHSHAANRGSREQCSRPSERTLHYEPGICGSRSILRLEVRHGPHPPTGGCGCGPATGRTSSYGKTGSPPVNLRSVPDHRL